MRRIVKRTVTEKIFENILFLAEVFGDQADKDIPKIPVLEMAQCFELPQERGPGRARSRHRERSLWN
jgi:hypothetical protein